MKGAHDLTFAGDLPAPALSLLETHGAAAWVIDVAGGCILAANAAGRALLGLEPGSAPPVLDAAMPALACLRTLAANPGRHGTAPKPLLFWTSYGIVRPKCRIEILSGGSLALVAATPEAEGHAEPSRSVRTSGPPVVFAGNDTAKLTEIARRIREGEMTGARADLRPHPDSRLASRDAAAPETRSETPFSLRSRLAHELKTPVSAIAAAAEIMKDERFGPLGAARYVGYAADIQGSAQHVLRVIDKMLAEGGAETTIAPGVLEFAEIDAGEALRASVSQLAPLAEQAGITLALDLAPRLPHIVADVTSVKQIVFNLVTNALKFTGHGGQVTVGAVHDGAGALTIVVSDTGTGMAESDVARARAPRQGRRAARQGGAAGGTKGLGLGLPMVQALAEANGAALIIESAPGKGTSASIVFPKDRVIPI